MNSSGASPTIAVVGAGAAGLFAAIWAGRRVAGWAGQVIALDGARTLGAKILVAGGGRCNVTHGAVGERDFAGSTPAAIRRVLSRFGVPETIQFFAELGVTLKQEETGKLFPVDDRARSVLEALLRGARAAGVELRHPWRVVGIERLAAAHSTGDPREHPVQLPLESSREHPLEHPRDHWAPRFRLRCEDSQTLDVQRVILATGGCSLPKSGSDGVGHALARALGHTVTPRIAPALVPLCLAGGHPLRELSGVATAVSIEVRSATGRRLVAVSGDLLCTHFGLSGPAVLDVSRHWSEARATDTGASLVVNWLPGESVETIESAIAAARERGVPTRGAPAGAGASVRTAAQFLRGRLPERLAATLLHLAEVDPQALLTQLTREQRRRLAETLCATSPPVVGDRGWTHAEVTAGGVPLREVDLSSLESRVCPGLYLCGEILDVDGRIGGFNFQWAWASGFVAGGACGDAVSR